MEPAGAPKAPKALEEEAGAAAEEEEGIAKLSPFPNGVAAAPAMKTLLLQLQNNLSTATKHFFQLHNS